MGRHATPAAPSDPEGVADDDVRPPARFLPRLVLAATAGVTTMLAIAWAGNPWSSAATAGAAVAVVVLAAAWLAGTVPGVPADDPADPSTAPWTTAPGPDLHPQSRPQAGRDPVQ